MCSVCGKFVNRNLYLNNVHETDQIMRGTVEFILQIKRVFWAVMLIMDKHLCYSFDHNLKIYP